MSVYQLHAPLYFYFRNQIQTSLDAGFKVAKNKLLWDNMDLQVKS